MRKPLAHNFRQLFRCRHVTPALGRDWCLRAKPIYPFNSSLAEIQYLFAALDNAGWSEPTTPVTF
jgi:hypothetical protein